MNASLDKFTPVAAVDQGFQVAALSGPVLLSDLFTIPAQANSAWLQATAAIQFRLDGDNAAASGLELPAQVFLSLSNVQELAQLVLIGSASVSVQFGTGDVGPIPPVPLVRSSGGGGGGGTVTSVDVSGGTTGFGTTGGPITSTGVITLTGKARVDTPSVLHVMPAPAGDDATGLPYRLDRPYATPNAAEADAIPGDTIMIWAGDYQAANLGQSNNVNFELVGAILRDYGTDPVFNLLSTIATVSGMGRIEGINGTPFAVVVGAGSEVRLNVPVYSDQTALQVFGGSVLDMQATVTGGVNALHLMAGRVNVWGEVVGDIYAADPLCDTTIFGNVNGNMLLDGGAFLQVRGKTIGDASGQNGSRLLHIGDVAGSITFDTTAFADIRGNIIGDVFVSDYGTLSILGNVQGDLTADTVATLTMRGNLESASNGLRSLNSSIVFFYGNVTNTGTGRGITAAGRSKVISTGMVNSDGDALYCDTTGTIVHTGVAEAETGFGAYCAEGIVQIDGGLVAQNNFGAQVAIGELWITGRVQSCRACVVVEDSTAPYQVVLGAGTVLVANTGSCSAITSTVTLDGLPVVMTCMGVFANLPFEPAVTALVQAPVVDPNVK